MDGVGSRWEQGEEEAQVALLDELREWLGGGKLAPAVPRGTTPDAPAQFVQPVAVLEAPKRKGGRPKGSKNAPKDKATLLLEQNLKLAALKESGDKAALKAEHTRPLTEAEKRETLAQLAKEKPARDPQLIVNDAVLEVIVPNWAKTPVSPDGHRHFIVNAERKQERVSFELDKWKAALSLNKLPAGSVVFKPEGLGMSPGSLETGRAGNAWRVMIG